MDRAGLEAEVRRLRRELRAAERVQRPAEPTAVQLERRDALRRLADLYDLAPVGYLTLDREGIIRAINLTAATLFGRRRKVLVGYPLLSLVAKNHQREYLAHITRLRRGGAQSTVEVEVLGPDHAPVPVQLISVASSKTMPAQWFPTVMVDLTARRAAEEALQRERGLLASVMAATDVMLVYLDREFNFVWVNDAYAQTCGYRAEDMVGRNHFELYPHAENEAIFRRVRDTGEPAFYKDKPFQFPDQPERGTTYWDWSLTPVKNPGGDVTGLVFSLRDTTPFRRAEEDLFDANQRLQAVLRSVPVGVSFSDDPTCRRITGNPAVAAQFGAGDLDNLSASATDPAALGRRVRYFREGREVRDDELPLQRAVVEDREVEPLELEVELPNGRRWSTLASGAPLHDPAGHVAGGVAVTVDITARKQSERALERALAQAQRRETEQASLLQAARTALEKPDFGDAAKTILASCRAAVGGEAGLVALCSTDGLWVRIVHCDTGGLPTALRLDEPIPLRGLRERVHATRQALTENAFAASPWAGLLPEGHIALESVLLAPLLVGNDVLGFLGLANKPGGFTADDSRLAQAFAEMAAVALLNHRTLKLLETNQQVLESQVRERTAQLERINALLDSERRRFYSLLEELPIFVFLRAPDCSIRFANRYFREHFGQPAGRCCYEVLGAGDAPCAGCRAAAVLENHIAASWEWNSPRGKTYQIHNYPFQDVDGTELVLEAGIDVTGLRRAIQAEQQARRTADTLRASSLALTRTLELDVVLGALLEHLRGLVLYDRARVMILEGDSRLAVRAAVDADSDSGLPPFNGAAFDSAENPVIHDVIANGTAAVIPDLHTHPAWAGRMQPSFAHSWMGVPLLAHGRVVGMFSLSKHEAGFFTDDHLRLAEALSAQASVAVENAMLFEEVQAARARMQTLSRRLVQVQEAERRTIARELHDEAGQSLTSLLYGLRVLERDQAGNPEASARAAELTRTAESVLESLHGLAANLRPASLEHLGLEAAIRQHLAGIGSSTGLQVRFKAHGLGAARLPSTVEIALYRIVQEALTNVVRHARATSVDVLAERREGRLVLVVEDNGAGFDTAQAAGSEQLGLLGMKERAEAVGGTLTVESAPSVGTTVVADVPFPDVSSES